MTDTPPAAKATPTPEEIVKAANALNEKAAPPDARPDSLHDRVDAVERGLANLADRIRAAFGGKV